MAEPYVFRPTGALGNNLLQLTSMQPECTMLHDTFYDYELANCMTVKGFQRVSFEGRTPEAPIYINPHTMNHVHPKIRDIIEPTPFMKRMIEEARPILGGVSCGLSIRRGSYCDDSTQFRDERNNERAYYFCDDQGLEKFRDIIRRAPGNVFVSSDSASTMKALQKEFGTKIRTLDTDTFVIGMPQDGGESKTPSEYHSIYLRFFILSECPHVFLTGGTADLVGFSTYAYMAAIYGTRPFDVVFNSP